VWMAWIGFIQALGKNTTRRKSSTWRTDRRAGAAARGRSYPGHQGAWESIPGISHVLRLIGGWGTQPACTACVL